MIQPTQTELIPLDDILAKDDLQMRAGELDWEFVDTLTDTLRDGGELPPLTVFVAGDRYLLADGFHRHAAYCAVKAKLVPVNILSGGEEAAFRHALGANADQLAKPRTRKDIRRAVTEAIMQCIISKPKAEQATQQDVAAWCKVNQSTVSRIYNELNKSNVDASKTSSSAPSKPKQIDFFERLNQDFAQPYRFLDQLITDERWLDDAVPASEKAEGLQGLINRLAELETKAKDKLAALKQGGQS